VAAAQQLCIPLERTAHQVAARGAAPLLRHQSESVLTLVPLFSIVATIKAWQPPAYQPQKLVSALETLLQSADRGEVVPQGPFRQDVVDLARQVGEFPVRDLSHV
jgi:hypothetical protein